MIQFFYSIYEDPLCILVQGKFHEVDNSVKNHNHVFYKDLLLCIYQSEESNVILRSRQKVW